MFISYLSIISVFYTADTYVELLIKYFALFIQLSKMFIFTINCQKLTDLLCLIGLSLCRILWENAYGDSVFTFYQ